MSGLERAPSEDFGDDTLSPHQPSIQNQQPPSTSERHNTLLPTDSVVVDGVDHGRLADLDNDGDDKQSDEGGPDGAAAAAKRKSCHKRTWNKWRKFYAANSFLILVVCAILLALAYPPLGAIYLAPQITATWIAVVFIFVLAGLGLKTEELSKAFSNVWFNAFVQVFNFGVVSSVVFGFSRFLISVGALAKGLGDGMVICASLPLTINMVLVLTKSSGGDEAAAVFNAAFGNLVGVFLTPVLILGYLGVSGDINLGDVFYKLGLRVLLPIAVGQLLQKFSKTVVNFVKKYKKYFKKCQEYCLIFIIYTVFCRTFYEGSEAKAADIFLMIALQFVLLCFFMVLSWYVLQLLFRNQPKLRVMGLYGCTHKTVAMGVPLINAIYESNPNVGLYTLPLLIWHPMQLVIGSAIAPRLSAWVDREEKRLAADGDNVGLDETSTADADVEGGNGDLALDVQQENK